MTETNRFPGLSALEQQIAELALRLREQTGGLPDERASKFLAAVHKQAESLYKKEEHALGLGGKSQLLPAIMHELDVRQGTIVSVTDLYDILPYTPQNLCRVWTKLASIAHEHGYIVLGDRWYASSTQMLKPLPPSREWTGMPAALPMTLEDCLDVHYWDGRGLEEKGADWRNALRYTSHTKYKEEGPAIAAELYEKLGAWYAAARANVTAELAKKGTMTEKRMRQLLSTECLAGFEPMTAVLTRYKEQHGEFPADIGRHFRRSRYTDQDEWYVDITSDQSAYDGGRVYLNRVSDRKEHSVLYRSTQSGAVIELARDLKHIVDKCIDAVQLPSVECRGRHFDYDERRVFYDPMHYAK